MTACCNRFYNNTNKRAITTRFIHHPAPSGTALSQSYYSTYYGGWYPVIWVSFLRVIPSTLCRILSFSLKAPLKAVSLAAVFSIVTQRSSPQKEGAARETTLKVMVTSWRATFLKFLFQIQICYNSCNAKWKEKDAVRKSKVMFIEIIKFQGFVIKTV